MMFKKVAIAAAAVAAGMGALMASPAAQAQEQFVPLLVYRTGQFAPWVFHGQTASRITSSWSMPRAASTA
jgi:ABC-type sugar transport system substrate-binding protein